jgi:hypothetical protein
MIPTNSDAGAAPMNWRQGLTNVLAVTMLASLVAAKFLWATTLWYEWIALAVAGVCGLALGLLQATDQKAQTTRPKGEG